MVKVVQKSIEHPVLEIVAQDIKALSEFGRSIQSSKLKQKAILVLLSHTTQLSQRDIKTVLDAIPLLEKEYLK